MVSVFADGFVFIFYGFLRAVAYAGHTMGAVITLYGAFVRQ